MPAEKYRIRVERGDTNVLTKELLKKISEQISGAALWIDRRRLVRSSL
jgi:hypothetical protein